MALFKVTKIIDGNTIEVEGWSWKEKSFSGKIVKIQGYDASPISELILRTLILDKEVDLKTVIKAEKGTQSGTDILYCSVFLNDIDISKYLRVTAEKS